MVLVQRGNICTLSNQKLASRSRSRVSAQSGRDSVHRSGLVRLKYAHTCTLAMRKKSLAATRCSGVIPIESGFVASDGSRDTSCTVHKRASHFMKSSVLEDIWKGNRHKHPLPCRSQWDFPRKYADWIDDIKSDSERDGRGLEDLSDPVEISSSACFLHLSLLGQ